MKLYIWCNPYHVSYGSSMVFAVADSLPAARTITAKGKAYTFVEYGNENDVQRVKLGKPDRIVNLPCAEWHEWCE